jgi:hypothetical protein
MTRRHWIVVLTLLLVLAWPGRVAHADGGWLLRMPLTIRNDSDAVLTDHQVRVVLDGASFDFARARADLADLRFTAADGVTAAPHWVESFNGRSAVIWVKVPRIEARAPVDLYLYFGNAVAADESSGFRTFDFFDDFSRGGAGYFSLGEPRTISVQDQTWETQAPHTLSVVELNQQGFRYWGYYGLADCGGIGVLRSNDLSAWEKAPAPLLRGDGERWPSAQIVDGRVYLVYDRDHCATSHVVMRVSTDGARFDAPYTTLVAAEPSVRNQNPHLFWNPLDRRFYLYWFRGGAEVGRWQIKARSAATPEGLADPASERVLLDVPYTLAAPNMLFHDGVFYLSTEVNENAWKTKIYAGPTALGPFAPLPGDIVLSNNEACWFQHVFNGALHGFYCKDTRGDGTGWVLQQRVGSLAGRGTSRAIDRTFWTPKTGDWRIEDSGDGAGGRLRADAGALIEATIPAGADRIVEARGGDVRVVNGKITLAGAPNVAFDDVRMRKADPGGIVVTLGPAEPRRAPSQAWFDVGARAHAISSAPTSLGLLSLLGPLMLLGGAWLVYALISARFGPKSAKNITPGGQA